MGGAVGVDFLSFVTIVTVGCSKHCSIQYCNVFSKPGHGHGVAQGDTKSYSGTSYEHNQHVSSKNKNETVTMDLETR